MAAGVAFDPAEFAAFKSGLAAPVRDAASPAPAGDMFDPAEFQAFKASRSGAGQREAAPASFGERFGNGPMASTLDTSTPAGSALRRVADERLVGKPSLENQVDAGLFRGANAIGLNLPRNAMAGIEALRSGRSFGDSYREVSDIEDALARQYPKTATAGTVGGVVGGAFALPPIGKVAQLGRVGQAALTGGLYGAAAEAADTKDLDRTFAAGALGAGLGGAGGYVLEKAAPVVSRLFARNAPFRTADGALTDQASTALRKAGIDPAAITPELAQHIETTFAAKGPSVAAAREAQAAEFGLPLSRGQATADPQALAQEGRALAGQSGPRAQQIGDEFSARQADALATNRDRFLGMAAGDAPRIERPQEAFEAVADRARQAAQAEAERTSIAQRAQDDALRAVRGRGETDALDAAAMAAQGVRDAASQGKAGYRAAYDDVGALPHVFDPGALDMLGTRVRSRLGADVPIDDRLTPAAHRALQDLDQVPEIFNLAPGQGPSLAQTEQLRRRMGALYPSTAQNPTDRLVLGRVMDEFDNHLNDAAAIGALNRPASRGAADLAGDGFPGAASLDAPSAPLPAAGGAPARPSEPETLTRYLARGGGVPLDAEARAADLHRLYVPGQGTLARNGAPTWDQLRVRLAEEGFLPPGMDGSASSRDVADWARQAIHAERVEGRPTLRMGDEAQVGGRRAVDAVSDQNTAHADLVDRQARRMAIDLEGYGIGARDLDRGALNDAAEHMVLGRHTDPVDAYEAALTAREATSAGRAAEPAHDIPFDGATARATSDALPIGDTAPLEAMQRARGLFREYQQRFKPRGPGDTAGANLRRIVERDASPNEVASMLFGSTTGRVSPGQMQTLARLREAVGAESEPWAAVQRGIVARHLGGEGRDLGDRLRYLVRGEGRGLMSFLSPDLRSGLGQLEVATRQAQAARQAVPSWAADLERTGFDPNAIGRSLFGSSGAIGAKPGAVNEARAAKAFLGADSQEWSGLRQAAVQRLMDPATPATKMIAGLRDFTDGAGKGVASTLFSPEELSHLRRFSGALQATIRPDGTIKSGAAGEAGRKAVAKAMDLIAGAIAFKVGGLGAAAGTYGAKVGTRAVMGGIGAASARRSFEGGAPRLLAPPPMLPLGQLATGEGLALGQR
ncbi:hypothetical protein MKK63_11005 [Methylobacterium sp. J-088]|uniref:hypothetical protein n=1 Tax=Methylobacterium sp. J-088 TaxID=2836664 RepID=UPI001FBB767E|nr:hypothetical protein [Methylobacterium sp. J-088]MCJ2063238.1 hypothetical protein [Methylobacterium sp. J-088]